MKTDETPEKFIQRKITEAFSELAGEVANLDLSEDVTAGVPFALFSKEQKLLAAWQQIVNEGVMP